MTRRRICWKPSSQLVILGFLAALCWAWPGRIAAQSEPPSRFEVAELRALEAAFVNLAQEVRPSVVAVRTYHLRRGTRGEDGPAMRSPRSENQGSGFILTAAGHVLTNNHVVEGADDILVVLHNGQEEQAALVQRDVRHDLAVIKIEAEHLKPVEFGDPGTLKVGQWAFAVGNPFGLANVNGRASVTVGNISGLGRDLTGPLTGWRADQDQYYGNLIETSATINPGNSGGPLFNLSGQVIGVVTAIETRSGVSEGMGFAIPIDLYTKRIVSTLMTGQPVHYGFLGITTSPPDWSLIRHLGWDHSRGAIVMDVADGLPAAAAGLKRRDLIVEFDGQPVEDPDHLVRLVGATPAGTESSIKYIRDGHEHTVRVVLEERGSNRDEEPTRNP